MSDQSEIVYKVQKKDLHKTGAVLADAFLDDPVWKEVMQDVSPEGWNAFFESPARYCFTFGNLYAPSAGLEGLIGWVPGRFADMTFWRILRCGSVFSSSKVGLKTMLRMKPIFKPLEAARKKNTQDLEYIYCIILGVARQNQGRGLGSRLIHTLLDDGDQQGLPVYLETSTKKNIRMYENRGFKVIDKIMHPIINLPQWCMMREPVA